MVGSHLLEHPGERARIVCAMSACVFAAAVLAFSSVPVSLPPPAFVVSLVVPVATTVGAADARMAFSAGFVLDRTKLDLGCARGCDLGLTCVSAWISSLLSPARSLSGLSVSAACRCRCRARSVANGRFAVNERAQNRGFQWTVCPIRFALVSRRQRPGNHGRGNFLGR